MRGTKRLTIGILAHVDAGKTSLTESLLYASGAVKHKGSVDNGSTITDAMEAEKERGISIKSAAVNFQWKGVDVNVVDTPGHIDFSAEVDRALAVLDAVVLVVSAVEGVQAHTLNLFESLKERGIPMLVFINKIDRMGADIERVFQELEKDLNIKLFAISYTEIVEGEAPKVKEFEDWEKNLSTYILDQSMENLADIDESFLEDYLNGKVEDLEEIASKAKKKIKDQSLIPLCCGSAKLGLGTSPLLDLIVSYREINIDATKEPSARIFRVEYDNKLGRLAHLRMFSGSLKPKDVIWSNKLQKEIKVNQVYQNALGKKTQHDELTSGELGMITCGEIVLAGDSLGKKIFKEKHAPIHQSVLSVQAVAKEEKNYQKLGEALEILTLEDPDLNLIWYKEKREFHLSILGPIQAEVLKDSLLRRFNLHVDFLPPTIVYKETPKASALGHVKYWMPKPCWAIMTFKIEPGEPGSGVVFESKVRTSDISTKYQNEVRRAIPWSLKQGLMGWEVTDIIITLIEGEEHTMHSNPGDFLLATPMGVMRGIEVAGTELLEPIYTYNIKVKKDLLGPIVSDLNQMNATIGTPKFEGDYANLTGQVAVSKSLNYGVKFNSTTSGKGRLKLTISGYEKIKNIKDLNHTTRLQIGVSPLDESLWILHNRGAFKAEDRLR